MKPPDLRGLTPGQAGEEWVAYLYRKNGYKILYRNYTVYSQKKLGEIDIVAKQGHRLVMVEVKTRSGESFMPIEEAVHPRKQRLLRRMAALFLQAQPEYDNWDLQIDVAAVLMNPFDNVIQSVKLIENAIEDTR